MPASALVCRGLVKRYGSLVAVDGLDLEVERGECFGLLGPNGAGKTTSVEIFEGLRTYDDGEVEVLGRRWDGEARGLRKLLGVQLQEAQLAEKLTALETVTLFRSFYPHGADPRATLSRVGLDEKAGTWVRDLSGGQRQRLSLACALVCEPELLFLDEPTTGLDPQSRRRVWEIVEEFRANGGTVLLTTHSMEEAERLCDRVAIVDHGRVVAVGSPLELISRLDAEQVVEFATEGPIDLNALERLSGVNGVARAQGTVSLRVSEVHLALPALLAELGRQGCELSQLATRHATLEDVFMMLTGRHLRED